MKRVVFMNLQILTVVWSMWDRLSDHFQSIFKIIEIYLNFSIHLYDNRHRWEIWRYFGNIVSR